MAFRALERAFFQLLYICTVALGILKQVLQVLLNCLARRYNLCFFGACGHMFHNDNHEGFDTFLQFPDFFFNKCRFLDQLNGSFVSTGRRNKYSPRIPR